MNASKIRTLSVDLPDGKCLFIEKNTEGTTYINKSVSNSSFEIMERMQNQEILCDVTLVAENIEVPAHKLILAASSIVFYSMFSNITGYFENRILLDGVHHEALTALIHYFYTSKLLITEVNVRYLLRASELFVLTDVLHACSHFLETQLTPYNCLNIANFAREHSCSELVDRADAFIAENFSEIVCYEDFLDLPHQWFSDIIKRDTLVVPNELQVFNSVIAWIKHDIEKRKQYLVSLMEMVRFPLMSPRDLIQKVQEEPLLKTNIDCWNFVMEAMNYHYIKASKNHDLKFSSRRMKPRLKKIMMVVGYNYGEFSMEKYDFEEQRWQQGPNSFENKFNASSIIVLTEDRIYQIGGSDTEERNVSVFDVANEKWSEYNNLLEGREDAAATILDNNIYVTGGKKGDYYLKSCVKFDLETGKWTKLNDMLDGRWGHDMCAMNGKIYAFGGKNEKYLSSVECYSPETDSWISLPHMTTPRLYPSVAVLNSKLYVVGGYPHLQSAEVFDPVSNNWNKLPDMHTKRFGSGVVALHGLLYVTGGYDGKKSPLSMEVYNPESNTWTMLPNKMNNRKNGAKAITINVHHSKSSEEDMVQK